MNGFPMFLYHKELAPEGKLFCSQAEVQSLGHGWIDTPAKFDCPVVVAQEPEVIVDDAEAPKRRGRPKKVEA